MNETDWDGVTPVLDDAGMRALGFTDHREGYWYFSERVGDRETLNISIEKTSGAYTEHVLDEDFGQPAHYGNMLPKWRWKYRDAVDTVVRYLNAGGLDIAVDHRAYGFKDGETRCANC